MSTLNFKLTIFVVNETTRKLMFECLLDEGGPVPRLVLKPGPSIVPPFRCVHILVPAAPEYILDASEIAPVKVWDGVPTLVAAVDGREEPVFNFVSMGQGICFTEAEDGEDVVRLTFQEVQQDLTWFAKAVA